MFYELYISPFIFTISLLERGLRLEADNFSITLSRRYGAFSLFAFSNAFVGSSFVSSVQYAGVPGCCLHESLKEPLSTVSKPSWFTSKKLGLMQQSFYRTKGGSSIGVE